MKKISTLALSLVLLGFSNATIAQDDVTEASIIASWDFTTTIDGETNPNVLNYGINELAATTADSDLTVGALTRSEVLETNVTEQTSTLNIWGSRDFNTTNTMVYEKNDYELRASEAIEEGKYITFSIAPNADKKVSISGIDEYIARASGTLRMRWQYQVGNGEFKTIDTRGLGTEVVDFSLGSKSTGTECAAFSLAEIQELQNVKETITFRILIYQGGQDSKNYVAGFFNSILAVRGSVEGGSVNIDNNEMNNTNISVEGQTINIQSANAASASVYSISGELISTQEITNGNASFNINNKGLYLVKVGNKTSKVIL